MIISFPTSGMYAYRPTPVLISLSMNGPIRLVMTSPKMDFSRWVCRILVDEMLFPIVMKIVLRPIPIWYLNKTSRRIPNINVMEPNASVIFKYFSESILKPLNNWVEIKKNPINPKNIMSFPLDDPIKNKYVIGLIIGFKLSVRKITPASNIKIIPIKITKQLESSEIFYYSLKDIFSVENSISALSLNWTPDFLQAL